MKVFRLFSVLFLLSSPAFATPNFSVIEEYFEALKHIPTDTNSHGSLCEQMAKFQMSKTYDDDIYDIVVGIVYWNDTRIVGELDLVVFRKHDNEAIAIAEVKCQRRLSRALNSAKDQLRRFETNVNRDWVREMYLLEDSSQRFYPTSFDEQPVQWTIGQKGAVDAGFVYELELELDDIMYLHRRITRCQENNSCDLTDYPMLASRLPKLR